MKIGISSTNISLTENVYKRFGRCPVYVLYDTESGKCEHIYNYCRFYPKDPGAIAAQLFVKKKVNAVITGVIDDRSLKILNKSSIEVLSGYPGTCREALDNYRDGKLKIISGYTKRNGKENRLNNFVFFDHDLSFGGKNILFDDWDFILKLNTTPNIPKNWLNPINYAEGSYQLTLRVEEMRNTKNPIEFEISWCNHPEEEHSNIPHLCSYGHYCRFTDKGVYQHIAFIDDMEKTSVDGREEQWDWTKAWDSPFVLVKPYGQKPFPIKFRITLSIFEALYE
jgi:predicted Fe-Mo cluster-binding NifX family protein